LDFSKQSIGPRHSTLNADHLEYETLLQAVKDKFETQAEELKQKNALLASAQAEIKDLAGQLRTASEEKERLQQYLETYEDLFAHFESPPGWNSERIPNSEALPKAPYMDLDD
jgi:chromosome segregation ATPase